MKSIAIENGDIAIRDKRLQIIDERKQIIQKITGVLSIYKNELFYNAGIGIDRNMVFPESKINDTNEMKRLAIMDALGDIEEVDSVRDLEIIKEGRTTIANMKLKLKTGEDIELGGVDVG